MLGASSSFDMDPVHPSLGQQEIRVDIQTPTAPAGFTSSVLWEGDSGR